MRKKTLCLNLAAIAMFTALGLKMYNQHPISAPAKDITMANIEAILGNENGSDPEKGSTDPEKGTTDPEKGNTGSLETKYTRESNDCKVYVGANVKVTLGKLGEFKADGSGYISFPEQVTCCSGGNKTCRPVECIDVMNVIF